MLKGFKQYTEEIKSKSSEIPKENLVFWGNWFCSYIFTKYQSKFKDFLSNKEIDFIKNLTEYLWKIVDGEIQIEPKEVEKKLTSLRNIDETNLDTTGEVECALYELIVSLDLVLSNLNQNVWAYNLSQSTINIIDTILDEDDIDILSDKGAESELFQNEMDAQLKMIKYLQSNVPVKSDAKNLFRGA
jgi:hypothetical protein